MSKFYMAFPGAVIAPKSRNIQAHNYERNEKKKKNKPKYKQNLGRIVKLRGDKAKKVLLLSTTPRSGSSFLGSVLNSYHGSFYVYEPSRQTPKSMEEFNWIYLEEGFSCKINKSKLVYSKLKGINGFTYPDCIPTSDCKKKITFTSKKILYKKCSSSKFRVIKTVRVRLSNVINLMKNKIQDLKVIHLMRDPRGSFTSAAKLDWGFRGCRVYMSDIKAGRIVKKLYPDQ